ncbi:hypothetical protein Tco_0727749, partial [Tanacetum coccineum]
EVIKARGDEGYIEDGQPQHYYGKYIRLEEERAHRRGKVYNWETAKYDSENDNEKVNMPSFPSLKPTVSYFDDLDFLKDFENEFLAIIYNDVLTSKSDSSTKPVEIHHCIDDFDLKDETSLSKYDEGEQNILYFNDLFPFNIIYLGDLKSDKDNDDNEIDIIQSLEDMDLPPRDQRHQYLGFEGLQYTDVDIADFETRLGKIYRREVHRVLVFDFVGLTDLMAKGLSAEEIETAGFGLYWAESGRQISDEGDLSAYWREILILLLYAAAANDDRLLLVLLHVSLLLLSLVLLLMDVSAAGMDVGSVNVPYLLARYLRLFTSGRKQRAMISGGQFVARCSVVDEGASAVPAPAHAPQAPPTTAGPAKTMSQRLARMEDEVHEIRGSLGEQREVMDTMAKDLSRFTVWAVGGISQLLDFAGATYVRYSETHVPYQRRRVREMISNASTSTSQQDEQQPDP